MRALYEVGRRGFFEMIRALSRINPLGWAVLAPLVLVAGPSSAGETTRYTYDALGRLVIVKNETGPTDNKTRSYCFDKAGNRVTYNANSQGTPAGCVVTK